MGAPSGDLRRAARGTGRRQEAAAQPPRAASRSLPPSSSCCCFPTSVPVSESAPYPPIQNQTLLPPQPHSVPSPSGSPSHQTARRLCGPSRGQLLGPCPHRPSLTVPPCLSPLPTPSPPPMLSPSENACLFTRLPPSSDHTTSLESRTTPSPAQTRHVACSTDARE